MKKERHSKILEIIKSDNIETQEDLTKRLMESGITVTQATVSRDIKELRLIKILTDDELSIYAVPKEINKNFSSKLQRVFKESVISVDYASNIVIIKTLSGMASAAATTIDTLDLNTVLGSIAGDDTIMVVIRTENEAHKFVDRINEILKNDKKTE